MSIGAVGSSGCGCGLEQLNELRQKMFNKMDQDGDGSVSKSEFESWTDNRAQKTGRTMDADQVFASIDTNQDGVIDKSENDAALEQMHHHRHPHPPEEGSDLSELLEKIFAAMDTNQDGVVDKTEYEAALQQLGNQAESTTASEATADNSTSETATSDAASTSTASTEDNSLASLLAQFLELLGSMEKDYYAQYSQESQNQLNVNSYA